VFCAVVRTDTDIKALICRNLEAVGRTGDTILTAFTDGCPGLRGILGEAGVRPSPLLDWFHIAMRLNHLKQGAGALSADANAFCREGTQIAADRIFGNLTFDRRSRGVDRLTRQEATRDLLTAIEWKR
jgi:hypothetical protein